MDPPTSKLPNSHLHETTDKEMPQTKTGHKTGGAEETNKEAIPPIKIIPPPQPLASASAWKLLPNSTDFPASHDLIPPLIPPRKLPSPLPSSQCSPPGKPSLTSKSNLKSKETISTTATVTKDGDGDEDRDENTGLNVEVKKEVGFAPYVDVIHYPVLHRVVGRKGGKEKERKKDEEVKAKNVLRKVGGWMKSFF